MLFLAKLAEKKIREAQEKGDFNDLPGKGKPLNLDEDRGVPAHLRQAYKVLKNGGMIPPELEMRKEKLTLEQLIATTEDEPTRKELQIQLTLKTLQLELAMERGKIKLSGGYREAVYQKLAKE